MAGSAPLIAPVVIFSVGFDLRNEFARCQNRFFDVIYRMLTEYFQLNQIRRNDIAGRQTVPHMKLCDTRCNDTAFFRRFMAVHPDVQDKGLGTLMAMTLESVARQEGVKRVTCSAREDAVEFFAKLGFVNQGEITTPTTTPSLVCASCGVINGS